MSDQAPPIQQGDTGAGPGGPTPLPYGESATLNRDLASAAQATAEPVTPTEVPAEAPSGGTAAAPPTETGSAGAPPEVFKPGMGLSGLSPDDEKYLFGPTDRPNETPQPLRMIAPQDVGQWLPDLSAEASRPDAPPQLKAIFKAIVLGPEG